MLKVEKALVRNFMQILAFRSKRMVEPSLVPIYLRPDGLDSKTRQIGTGCGMVKTIESTCNLFVSLNTACAMACSPLCVLTRTSSSGRLIWSMRCMAIRAGRFPLHWSAASFACVAMASTTLSAFALPIMTATIECPGRIKDNVRIFGATIEAISASSRSAGASLFGMMMRIR
jgi:hypothetical protein